MFILADKEVTFCLTDVNIIADVALIFIKNIGTHINRDLIVTLFDDWNTTFSFNI